MITCVLLKVTADTALDKQKQVLVQFVCEHASRDPTTLFAKPPVFRVLKQNCTPLAHIYFSSCHYCNNVL
jgi:hypothetical protein